MGVQIAMSNPKNLRSKPNGLFIFAQDSVQYLTIQSDRIHPLIIWNRMSPKLQPRMRILEKVALIEKMVFGYRNRRHPDLCP